MLTVMALVGATKSMRVGDHNRTNRMFRARIYAQGFTLVAMVAGSVYWQGDRDKRKEFDAVVAEKKAKEKNEAWIRELEARDQEEKDIKARKEAWRREQTNRRDAPSMIDAQEKRTSVLEAVAELIHGRR